MSDHWPHSAVVVRREELGLQPDAVAEKTTATGVWLEVPVFVVEDSPEILVSYIAPWRPVRIPERAVANGERSTSVERT